jgi:type IV pilus assembly protein PilB
VRVRSIVLLPGGDPLVEDISQKLLQANLVDENALKKAALQQKTAGGTITSNLVKIGAVSEEKLLDFLSKLYGCASLDLKNFEPDPALTRLLPGDVASKFMALPVSRNGRKLIVAMANPANIFALDDIKFITGYEVEPRVASEASIKKALDRAYDSASTMADVMKGFEDELSVVDEEETPENDGLAGMDEAPIVKLVNSLISDAVKKGASDIHIEPYEKNMRVRFRIDGALQEMMAPPYKFKAAITSRLKIMADLDIAERRVPQDGPHQDQGAEPHHRPARELAAHDLRREDRDAHPRQDEPQRRSRAARVRAGGDEGVPRRDPEPYGMVLVTGPTGSGKTTSLYSALSRVNTPNVNVMTARTRSSTTSTASTRCW